MCDVSLVGVDIRASHVCHALKVNYVDLVFVCLFLKHSKQFLRNVYISILVGLDFKSQINKLKQYNKFYIAAITAIYKKNPKHVILENPELNLIVMQRARGKPRVI